MDGGGVLYHDKDPFEVARLMAAILSTCALRGPDCRDAGRRARAAASEGLRRDAPGIRRPDPCRAARPAPEVPYDFWPQFDQADRLEELRQFRPAIYRALRRSWIGGWKHDAGRSTT